MSATVSPSESCTISPSPDNTEHLRFGPLRRGVSCRPLRAAVDSRWPQGAGCRTASLKTIFFMVRRFPWERCSILHNINKSRGDGSTENRDLRRVVGCRAPVCRFKSAIRIAREHMEADCRNTIIAPIRRRLTALALSCGSADPIVVPRREPEHCTQGHLASLLR